jgi:hypothetical protein
MAYIRNFKRGTPPSAGSSSGPVAGWWDRYPLCAVYWAGCVSESGAVYMVHEDPLATEEELKQAEEELQTLIGRDYLLLLHMGHDDLGPACTVKEYHEEGTSVMKFTIRDICNRMF